MFIFKKLYIVFILSLFIGSCTADNSVRTTLGLAGDGNIKKIAVLPFYNISGKKDAGRIISEAYVTEVFKSGKYEIEEPGNVRHFMIQERIGVIGELEVEKIQLLGKRLKVDAVLVGTVEEFSGVGGNSVVTVSARIIESESGAVIWMNHRRKKGNDYTIIFDFGEIKSVTGLAHKVVAEMVQTID